MNWLVKSFLVMFAYGSLLVLFAFIQKNFNIPTKDQFVIYLAGAGMGVLLMSKPWANNSFNFMLSPRNILISIALFLIAGFLIGGLINVLYGEALEEAAKIPSVGVAIPAAIVMSNVFVIFLISYFGYKFFPDNFYESTFNLTKFIGMVLSLLGLFLLSK